MELRETTLRIAIGARTVETVNWPARCPLEVDVSDGAVRMIRASYELSGPTLHHMPIVTGLFTDLDLSRGEAPAAEVTTLPYETTSTVSQKVAGTLSLLAAVIATILASLSVGVERPRLSRRIRAPEFTLSRHAPDATVVGLLLVWAILAPPFTDDGWIWTQLGAFDSAGSTHFYFDIWGIELPIGYWADWSRHFLSNATRDLVWLRIPTVAVLVASWFVCRFCLRRALGGHVDSGANWLLAVAFLTGAFAWGMTLRMEPIISLMALIVLGAMLSFVQAPRVAPLGIATLVAAMAATAHPAGLLAGAPLLAGIPEVVRWVRGRGAAIAVSTIGVLLAGAAVVVTCATLNSDVSTRTALARAARENDVHSVPFWREYVRYDLFDQYGGGTAVRHFSLGFLVFAVFLFAIRHRRREGGDATSYAARSLVIALVLLAFVPSKWPWHFGALVGVGAVAFAAEAAFYRRSAAEPRSFVRPGVLVALGAVVVLWSWGAEGSWSPLDLRESNWQGVFGFHGAGPALLSIAVACALLPTMLQRLRRPRPGIPSPGRFAFRLLATSSLAAIVVTCGVLASDAARSDWTIARQNIETLTSRSTCGLADILTPFDARLEPLATGNSAALIAPPYVLHFPCASSPATEAGLIEIPAVVVVDSETWLIHELDAPFSALTDLFRLRPVATGAGRIVAYAVVRRVDGRVRADAARVD